MNVTENTTSRSTPVGALLAPRYTIFLVDDDRDDLHHMMMVLKASPYVGSVHCFCSGDDMRKHFVVEGYYSGGEDLQKSAMILLDVHMPGTSGIALLRELKEHPHTAAIPVLLTTSDISSDLAREAEDLKVDGYATKPVNIEHIHEMMRRCGHDIPAAARKNRKN
ncbi:MAG: response regulator [Alphaproteobacteria bacterium]|nr:response regulator [Alphaproteobacteria bacterium]